MLAMDEAGYHNDAIFVRRPKLASLAGAPESRTKYKFGNHGFESHLSISGVNSEKNKPAKVLEKFHFFLVQDSPPSPWGSLLSAKKSCWLKPFPSHPR